MYVSYSSIKNKEAEEGAVSRRTGLWELNDRWLFVNQELGSHHNMVMWCPDLKLQPLEPWENTFLLFKTNSKNNGF